MKGDVRVEQISFAGDGTKSLAWNEMRMEKEKVERKNRMLEKKNYLREKQKRKREKGKEIGRWF